MSRAGSSLTAAGIAVLAIVLCAQAGAQEKQLYRYTDADGKVVYSDMPPPASAKNVQPKKIGANVIETNAMPLAAQQASERFPVTLYTFDCGDPCQSAAALLNRRGVPFTTVNVSDPAGAAKLMALTGANVAPVLQVGDKLVSKGLAEARWQAMLDDAGYPRTPPLRKFAPGTGSESPPVAANTRPPAPPAPGPAPAAAPAAAPADGGYPK
jgi:glutaredoxin